MSGLQPSQPSAAPGRAARGLFMVAAMMAAATLFGCGGEITGVTSAGATGGVQGTGGGTGAGGTVSGSGGTCSTFAAKVDYATGMAPSSAAVGDFNLDGKADLAVANFDSNTVSVLLGNGDGAFATKVDYATGSRPSSLAVGDFKTARAAPTARWSSTWADGSRSTSVSPSPAMT